MSMFEMTLCDTIYLKKHVPSSPLSIGKSCRSLAIVVVKLFHLHPPLFYSCVDNKYLNKLPLKQSALSFRTKAVFS